VPRAAEPWVYKAEVFGSAGLGRFYPANRIWRTGTELGGGFGFRPYAGTRRKLEFETRVEHIGFTGSQGQEGIWSETVEGTALSFSEAFLWHFTDSDVQPVGDRRRCEDPAFETRVGASRSPDPPNAYRREPGIGSLFDRPGRSLVTGVYLMPREG
jgi:hypothetical protein